MSTISQLALEVDIEDLLIPPSAYLYDRQLSPDIHVPYASGRRAFGARNPLPKNSDGKSRLPRVLRETSTFVLFKDNIKTEGLFRIPAHSKLKEILKEAYDRGQKYIIWKEMKVTLPMPNYPNAESSNLVIQELEAGDAYGVHLAAGLIKLWYSELREPVFPRSSYADTRAKFDRHDPLYSVEELQDLISPMSDSSTLPSTSRKILIRHLLPLLSTVAANEEQNKMSPDNLAVCFAPTLLCGEDPLEDAKMSSIVRKILSSAIQQWEQGLRQVCGAEQSAFLDELRPPARFEDYEDPPEFTKKIPGSSAYYEAQRQSSATGIVMADNDPPPREDAPPLPPRPPPAYESDLLTGWSESSAALKRKPAPQVSLPPRYSTVIAQDDDGVAESPTNYNADASAVTDGFGGAPVTLPTTVDEKRAPVADSEQPPQINIPKRKALTGDLSTGIHGNRDDAPARSMSESHAALSSIIAGQAAELVKRKPVTKTTGGSTEDSSPSSAQSDKDGQVRSVSFAQPRTSTNTNDVQFAKPTWAASTRPLAINTLARGIVPSGPSPTAQQQDSLPTPTYLPKARTPSPSLLERMPSFESGKSSPSLKSPSDLRVPGKLDMKKPSVDDLRKLYEERAGTAKTLVEAGVERRASASAATSRPME